MDPSNLLALMQAYQGAQGAPTMAGPVAPQQLAPGFRAPPMMSMQAPQQPQGGFYPSQAMGMLGLMSKAKPAGWVPQSSGSEPGRTAADADLGGYGGQPANPFGNPNAVPTVTPNPQATMPTFNQAMDQAYTNMGGALPQSTGWQGLGNFFRGLL